MADSNQDSLIAQLVDIAHVQPNEVCLASYNIKGMPLWLIAI